MDIGLPVMDGLQALEAIRADENLRATPVLARQGRSLVPDWFTRPWPLLNVGSTV